MFRAFLASACLALLGAGPALGQSDERAPLFEVTPFAGLRLGGNFDLDEPKESVDLDASGTFALALDLRIDDSSQYELFYGRQSTSLESGSSLAGVDIDVEYLHVGGTVAYDSGRRLVPYIVGGLGATRFSPDPGDVGEETRPSLSVGGGIRVPMSERFSLRLEGRGYLTLVDTDTAFFCRSDDGGALCRIRGSGSTFLQFELLAGAAFAF